MPMKKRIIIIAAVVIICAAFLTVFVQFGYFEYILDSGKIDRNSKDYSVVVTLSIGPNALIIKPYNNIVQVRSDKTVTINTFRVIGWYPNRFASIPVHRTYDDTIIKGKTKNLSDDEYEMLLEILKTSDFTSIQNEIDNATPWLDGNSTYITVREGSNVNKVGGHCAENKDKRFKNIMDCILGFVES